MNVKAIIKRYMPALLWNYLRKKRAFIENLLLLVSNYFFDLKLFYLYSSAVQKCDDCESNITRIIKDYHVIEKGLSFGEPRAGFGRGIIESTIDETLRYEERDGPHAFTEAAAGALQEYSDFNREHGLQSPEIDEFLSSRSVDRSVGGTITLRKDEIVKESDFEFASFVARRHSVRDFTGETISDEDLVRAVEIALSTPSVCNRQSAKAYIAREAKLIEKVLSFQNGNRGFGHRAAAIYVVTSDRRSFHFTGERNQPWIDGGLFAMTLTYAIHSLGFGACMLNWSVDQPLDRALKREMSIPSNEAVVMMIAIGVMPQELKVARSLRKDIRETAVFF